jgi:hypothetical protein
MAALIATVLGLLLAALAVAAFSLVRAIRRDAEAVAAARVAATSSSAAAGSAGGVEPVRGENALPRTRRPGPSVRQLALAARRASAWSPSPLLPSLAAGTAAQFSDSPASMSYSQSQLDAIGDVDPVAEADVEMAYGRDLQAEEILKEAIRGNPDRLATRTKLLEVYAKRRDTEGFEHLATQLYSLTNGDGEDWLKAQELGQQIDPENPLYRRREYAGDDQIIRASSNWSVDQLIDLEQQLEFFVALGQDQAAIDLLVAHVRASEVLAPLPLFRLMEVYRRLDNREAYERTRARLEQLVKDDAPEWDADPSVGRQLESYPWVLGRLQARWPARLDALAELEAHLLHRRPAWGVLDLPAYIDMLCLYQIARDLQQQEQSDIEVRTGATRWLDSDTDPQMRELAAVLRQVGDEDGARRILREIIVDAERRVKTPT